MIEYKVKSKMEIFSENNELIGNSMLMDVTDDFLYFSKPVKDGMMQNLKVGSDIRIVYYTKRKLYGFMSRITDEIMDNITLYQIEYPKDFYAFQRRRDARIPIVLDVHYVKLKDNEKIISNTLLIDDVKKYYQDRMVRCLSFDLSGQGIGIVTKEVFKAKDNLIIIVENPHINLIVLGQVRRALRVDNRRDFRMGIEFINIASREKERVIKFVFEKMRKQLKMQPRKRGD